MNAVQGAGDLDGRAGGLDLDLPAFNGDPAAAIEDALRRAHEMAARLGLLVDQIADGSLRYQGRVREQLRGEVTAYQAALRDLVSVADKMLRLRLGDRMATAQEVSAKATP